MRASSFKLQEEVYSKFELHSQGVERKGHFSDYSEKTKIASRSCLTARQKTIKLAGVFSSFSSYYLLLSHTVALIGYSKVGGFCPLLAQI